MNVKDFAGKGSHQNSPDLHLTIVAFAVDIEWYIT